MRQWHPHHLAHLHSKLITISETQYQDYLKIPKAPIPTYQA
jgi:hypothetical protein